MNFIMKLKPVVILLMLIPFSIQAETTVLSYKLSIWTPSDHSTKTIHEKKGTLKIDLEKETDDFYVGYRSFEVTVGKLVFQLRFNAKFVSKPEVRRSLNISLSGRKGSVSGKQVTWADGSISDKTWNMSTFSILGNDYQENKQNLYPTLEVSFKQTKFK